jgi:DNA-binding NtrC family response regulator
MSGTESILIVDDEKNLRLLLRRLLEEAGYRVREARDGPEALSIAEGEGIDLCLLDFRLPGMDGLEVMRRLTTVSPATTVVMMTAYGTVPSAVAALRAGAYDYLLKPFDDNAAVLSAVGRALERDRLRRENLYLSQELADRLHFRGIVGRGKAMQEVMGLARQVAESNASVLLYGESGTGKELMARYIHLNSRRREHPFVVLNCSAYAEGVIESELFGHEKGSFTGAIGQKKGRFELAHKGTLFVDEVGELAPTTQVKLLRVLQEQEFERVGGTQTIKVDVRIISATNKDLRSAVAQGRFREDLFYRLDVVSIPLPPLRERGDDIPSLAYYFLERYAKEMGKKVDRIDDDAMEALGRYAWPGNIRELENIIERAVVLTRGRSIGAEQLPETVRLPSPARNVRSLVKEGQPLTQIVEGLEREIIAQTLDHFLGSQSRAARSLGIKRTTLRYKMEKYDLLKKGTDENDTDQGGEGA